MNALIDYEERMSPVSQELDREPLLRAGCCPYSLKVQAFICTGGLWSVQLLQGRLLGYSPFQLAGSQEEILAFKFQSVRGIPRPVEAQLWPKGTRMGPCQ